MTMMTMMKREVGRQQKDMEGVKAQPKTRVSSRLATCGRRANVVRCGPRSSLAAIPG
jgi:hypothetical protein